jgi:hypothetical protein
MEIRSYRAVFDLERRIYRIDRLRLNPGGVPVRGVVYFFAVAIAATLISALPAIGVLAGLVPWYIREIAMPAGLAAVLAVLRIDGRPSHIAALSMLTHAVQARQLLGHGAPLPLAQWQPEALLSMPDGSDAHMRKLDYRGPGAVLVTVAHERCETGDGVLWRLAGRPQLLLRELPGHRLARPRLLEMAPGTRLRVR